MSLLITYFYRMKKVFLFFNLFIAFVACKEVSNTSKIVTQEEIATKYIASYDFDGLRTTLFNKQNDTTYVVNFWATWCKPCVEELPAFEKLQATYGMSKPLKVVLVSLDFPNKVQTQVIPFIKKNTIQSQVLLLDDADANRWIPLVDESWSGAIPATLIFKNKQQQFYERSFTYQELDTEVQSFLNSPL